MLKNGEKRFDGASRTAFLDTDLLASCHLHQPQISRLSSYFALAKMALTPGEFVRGFQDSPEKQIDVD